MRSGRLTGGHAVHRIPEQRHGPGRTRFRFAIPDAKGLEHPLRRLPLYHRRQVWAELAHLLPRPRQVFLGGRRVRPVTARACAFVLEADEPVIRACCGAV